MEVRIFKKVKISKEVRICKEVEIFKEVRIYKEVNKFKEVQHYQQRQRTGLSLEKNNKVLGGGKCLPRENRQIYDFRYFGSICSSSIAE